MSAPCERFSVKPVDSFLTMNYAHIFITPSLPPYAMPLTTPTLPDTFAHFHVEEACSTQRCGGPDPNTVSPIGPKGCSHAGIVVTPVRPIGTLLTRLATLHATTSVEEMRNTLRFL